MTVMKTPTVLQMEATECGAAAVGIILAYYGCHVSLAELRIACGVSRDGSKAINMLKAARHYKMQANAYQVTELDDLSSLPKPSILHWAFNHFVVFEGCDGDTVYINDPAVGHRMLDKESLSRGFTGVVLVMTPEPDFKPQGESFKWMDAVKRRLGQSRDTLKLILLLGFALVVPGLLIPGFTRIFIDDILVKETQSWLVPFLVGLGLTALFRAGVTYFQQSQLLKWQTQRLTVSSMQFVWHLLCLPLNFFTERYVGDMQERVAANERVAQWLCLGITHSFIEIATLAFYALTMLLLNGVIGALGLIILAINAYFLYTVVGRIADSSYQSLQQRGRLKGLQVSGLCRLETIKSRGAEAAFFTRFAGGHAGVMNAEHAIAMASLSLQWLPKTLFGLANALFIGLGGWFVMRGHLTLGSLVALQSLFVTMQSPIQSLIASAGELPKIKGDFARLDDVLCHPVDPLYERAEKTEVRALQGGVSLAGVSFGYAALEPPLLKNIELAIKPGMRIAIVGPTGSGKSTLGKLIARLLTPQSGELHYDAYNSEDCSRETLIKSVALVEQENFLFAGRVRDNLTLWNEQVSEDAMQAVLEEVGLQDCINARGGLDATVNEGGINFSGGERQRFELARALLRNPSLLILDEAMVGLSDDAEKHVFETLLKRSATVIHITHRLATVKSMDEIIVLDQGQIVERGSHDALIAQGGMYQRLYYAENQGG